MNKSPKIIVIGASLGGLEVIKLILRELPAKFPVPIVIVLHISDDPDSILVNLLNNLCKLKVREAQDKEEIQAGIIYTASSGYHLLIEKKQIFSLSVDNRVNYSRPSIDILFESAAGCFGSELIAVLLTGANKDGAEGVATIKKAGGTVVIQDPNDSKARIMPEAGINITTPDYIIKASEISKLLQDLVGVKDNR